MKGHYNVLFCARAIPRSIMAEAILNFKARISPATAPEVILRHRSTGGLKQLEIAHLPIQGLRSKAWDEFSCPVLQSSTLFLRFATTRRKKSDQSGPGSQ
jgi:hypothetical protein